MKVYESCKPNALVEFKKDVKKIWAAERADFEEKRATTGKLVLAKLKNRNEMRDP